MILSLEEAEAVRGLIHCKSGRPVLETAAEALVGEGRVMEGGGSSGGTQATGGLTTIALRANDIYLDMSTNHVPPRSYQQHTTDQCLRFLDSEVRRLKLGSNWAQHGLKLDSNWARTGLKLGSNSNPLSLH